MNPIEQVLRDLGMVRGEAYTAMLRLPAPDPLKTVLQQVDGLLGKLETDIRSIKVPAYGWFEPEALRNRP